MTTQPRPSREGQENLQDGHINQPTEIFSSGIEFPLNQDNPPQLRTPSVEHPIPPPSSVKHPTSPTVDDSDTQSNTKPSLIQEHEKCEADMDPARYGHYGGHPGVQGGREGVMGQTIGNPFEIIALLIQAFIMGFTELFRLLFVGIFSILIFLLSRWYAILSVTIFVVVGILISFIVYRHYVIASKRRVLLRSMRLGKNPVRRRGTLLTVLIVLGSGGHTSEMIRMVERSIQPDAFIHRRWAISRGDMLSFEKALDFEKRLRGRCMQRGLNPGTYDTHFSHRPRMVHQSWFTTPYTALWSLIENVFGLVVVGHPKRSNLASKYPDVIVSNGPGTGFIYFVVAHVLKIFYFVPDNKAITVFCESWARVNSLSLTGKLIRFFGLADVFIVQYPDLARRTGSLYSRNMVAMPIIPAILEG